MKKAFLALALVLVIGTSGAFAFGIGAQAGYDTVMGGGGAITFKLDEYPYVFAVSFSADNNGMYIGGSADYWFIYKPLAAPVNYYVGGGLGALVGVGDPVALKAVARLPLGINAYFLDNLVEPYLQIVPELGVAILPSTQLIGGIGANLGVRLWFN
jgi:hypothetical protein